MMYDINIYANMPIISSRQISLMPITFVNALRAACVVWPLSKYGVAGDRQRLQKSKGISKA